MNNINWQQINEKLPLERDQAGVNKRNKLFRDFDPNGNGYLSLAETDKAVRDVLKLDNLFDCKPVIMRAFDLAKKSGPKRTSLSDDYIEKNEFRLFLVYLRQYFEYYVMFNRIDSGNDKKISYDEFVQAIPEIEKMGFKVTEPAKIFASIDTNGGGQITFDEFCHWAIKAKLDLEDDDNFEDKDLSTMK
jgi:Ca2+-binding EF-hand superfamily protein